MASNPHSYSSRVFHSTTAVSSSSNWRADYYKFKGYSYAQVLKKSAATGQNQSKNTKNINSRSVRPSKGLAKTFQSKSGSNMSPQGAHVKAEKGCPKVKVGRAVFEIPCSNKFSLLQHFDTAVEPPSDVGTALQDTCHLVETTCPSPSQVKEHKRITASNQQNLTTSATVNDFPITLSHHKSDCTMDINEPDVNHGEGTDTKYDLPLRIQNKVSTYKQLLPSCPTLQAWDKQNKFKFGFIPLGTLKVPEKCQPKYSHCNPLVLHNMVKNSGDYNFMKSQITVKSQLNPDVWDSLLTDYWDNQLCSLIRFGFPLDFQRDCPLRSHLENHTSAKTYPQDVEAYLLEEIGYGAILGPFKEPPLKNLHVSPFMTREKPNAPHRRVIIDLSFPKGLSVNAGIGKDRYLGTPFLLKLPTIDTITNQIKVLGRGCMLYKIDISRAFRHVKIDPRDYDLLGLRHLDWYLDTCLPFGYRHGSSLYQRLSDAVRHIMRRQNYDVINYIDDILGIDLPSRIDASFDALRLLLPRLGFEISKKKLISPTTCMNCLGILIDTKNFTLAIPSEKLQDIMTICKFWNHKNSCTKRQLQSLLGSLLYVSKCVRSSRFFLNRLLKFLRAMEDKGQQKLTVEARRDINWFQKFLPTFNGVTFFDQKPVDGAIELDASLQGLGAVWGSQIYAMEVPLGYLGFQIVHLEMINILVALRIWGSQWLHKRISIACDNEAVVYVLNSGRTKDLTLAAIARNIQLLLATYNIEIVVRHIPGKDNMVADLLSRWATTKHPMIRLNQTRGSLAKKKDNVFA